MGEQELLQKIALTINTLTQIEIHGKQNLNYMLGCIQTLESVLEDINSESKEEQKEELNKENN